MPNRHMLTQEGWVLVDNDNNIITDVEEAATPTLEERIERLEAIVASMQENDPDVV